MFLPPRTTVESLSGSSYGQIWLDIEVFHFPNGAGCFARCKNLNVIDCFREQNIGWEVNLKTKNSLRNCSTRLG